MTKPSTLETFAEAVDLALKLPHPTDIYRAILSGSTEVDDGLKGTSYDSHKSSGGTPSSHPEKMLARKHPGQFPAKDEEGDEDNWEAVPGTWGARTDRAADDLLHLRRATDRVLESIATLNAECCDTGTPDTWDEALQDAHTLLEAGYLAAAIDVGRHVDAEALRFCHAIDTVRAIRDSWLPHEAPMGLGLVQTNRWCRSHQRVKDSTGRAVEVERATALLCRWCYRHVEDIASFLRDDHGHPATAVDLQTDPDRWPSEAMVAAKEQQRRVLLEREEAVWLRSLGLDPARVHQHRQARRAG